MADQEKKLGPNVTYTNPDKGAKLTTVAGVLLREGKSVDLVKKLGKEKADTILKKLAKNRYFKVDGGEDHSKASQEEAAQPDADQSSWAVNEEARIRARDGDEAADKFLDTLDEDGNVKAEQQPATKPAKPPPEEAELERPTRRT